MDVPEAKRLKQLEDENAKLKKLLAEQMPDAAALRELLAKKWWGPPPSAKVSCICRPRWVSQNGGPAQSSMLIAR
jgi:putative transposase